MSNKKKAEPLFYIQQPSIQFPESTMQEVYSSRIATSVLDKPEPTEEMDKQIKETLEDKEIVSVPGIDSRSNDKQTAVKDQQKVQEVIEAFEQKAVNEGKPSWDHKPSFQRLKSFKEMNIDERIDYLIHFPKQLPPVPCVYETDNSTIRGILVAKEGSDLKIRQFDGATNTIAIESIKDIKMAGLRR